MIQLKNGVLKLHDIPVENVKLCSKLKREKQKRKLKVYRILGAEQFQKVVFGVERFKYKVIKKFFPNIQDWYEKKSDRLFEKRIRKIGKENQLASMMEKVPFYKRKAPKGDKPNLEELLILHQKEKLAFRRELKYEENRNYHYDKNYPTKFVEYLNINKQIHQRGIIKNISHLAILAGISFVFSNPFPVLQITFCALEMVGLVINFECINLQNYNLCRFEDERLQEALGKREKRNFEKNLEQYGKCIEPVYRAFQEKVSLPTIDDTVRQIQTQEEKEQLIALARRQLEYLRSEKINVKQKQIGGRK